MRVDGIQIVFGAGSRPSVELQETTRGIDDGWRGTEIRIGWEAAGRAGGFIRLSLS